MEKGSEVAKVVLLIGLNQGADMDGFQSFFRALANRARSKLRERIGQTWSIKIPSSEMETVPHQVLMKDSPAPFDAMIQFSSNHKADRPEMINLLALLASEFGEYLDKRRSTVLVGNEVAITQGIGPVHLAMALRRLPSLTHEQFMAHWFGKHASIGEAVKGVHYRQNHVDAVETEALSARLGLGLEALDGLVDSYFANTEDAVELLSREEVSVGAIEDEKLFIDHSRSHFGFCRDFVQTTPGD
jgi:hypothetical protein